MGRLDRKSKKREGPSSRTRLARIEEKLERLISVLSETRKPQVHFSSPNSSSVAHRDQASDLERDVFPSEDVPNREIGDLVLHENVVATPVNQERPRDPGVFEILRSVNPVSRIGTTFFDSRNNPSSFAALITNQEIPFTAFFLVTTIQKSETASAIAEVDEISAKYSLSKEADDLEPADSLSARNVQPIKIPTQGPSKAENYCVNVPTKKTKESIRGLKTQMQQTRCSRSRCSRSRRCQTRYLLPAGYFSLNGGKLLQIQ